MPNAHNHCDAPPGSVVKYGNVGLETTERLVNIGHYEVQVTPDNCAVTLISERGPDRRRQIGHTVTFSKTQTIIHDQYNRYRLQYDCAADSRGWTMGRKPWRASPYSDRTSHCLAWTLDNHRKSTGKKPVRPPRIFLSHLHSGRLH